MFSKVLKEKGKSYRPKTYLYKERKSIREEINDVKIECSIISLLIDLNIRLGDFSIWPKGFETEVRDTVIDYLHSF